MTRELDHRQIAALRLLKAAGYRAAPYGDCSVVIRHPVAGLVVIPLAQENKHA